MSAEQMFEPMPENNYAGNCVVRIACTGLVECCVMASLFLLVGLGSTGILLKTS